MIGKLAFFGLLALTVAATTKTLPTTSSSTTSPSTTAPPAKKCEPEQWEALKVGRVAQINRHKPQVLGVVSNYSSDFTNKMVAVHEFVEVEIEGGKRIAVLYGVVADYNKMMMYEFRPEEKHCKKAKLMEKMEMFCNDTAKLTHTFMLDGKKVDGYVFEKNIFGRKLLGHISMFRDPFTPISEVIEQEYEGMPQMIALQYGNFMTGIMDKTVFDIPSYCN